jgi:hypothetical protein
MKIQSCSLAKEWINISNHLEIEEPFSVLKEALWNSFKYSTKYFHSFFHSLVVPRMAGTI